MEDVAVIAKVEVVALCEYEPGLPIAEQVERCQMVELSVATIIWAQTREGALQVKAGTTNILDLPIMSSAFFSMKVT